jgi:AbrB family looped-hinge helix DNA binding protein
MAKVTSKLQVTIPRELAERNGIRPGDEVEISEAAEGLRVSATPLTLAERLASFDAATKRQKRRQRKQPAAKPGEGRGWTREELYDRGRDR